MNEIVMNGGSYTFPLSANFKNALGMVGQSSKRIYSRCHKDVVEDAESNSIQQDLMIRSLIVFDSRKVSA